MEIVLDEIIESVHTADVFFNNVDENFILPAQEKTVQKPFFRSIFGKDYSPTLIENFNGTPDFAGYYLNLDSNNQNYLLSFLGIDGGDQYPIITDDKMVEIKEMYPDDELDRSTINSLLKIIHGMNDVELYPPVIVLFRKLFLFFYNNGISGNIRDLDSEALKATLANYTGEKYGNFTNWKTFWHTLNFDNKAALINHVLNVYKG